MRRRTESPLPIEVGLSDDAAELPRLGLHDRIRGHVLERHVDVAQDCGDAAHLDDLYNGNELVGALNGVNEGKDDGNIIADKNEMIHK